MTIIINNNNNNQNNDNNHNHKVFLKFRIIHRNNLCQNLFFDKIASFQGET